MTGTSTGMASKAVESPATGSSRRSTQWAGPAMAGALVLAVLAGAWLVRTHPYELFGLAFGGAVLVLLCWILVSVLHPAKADRTCPRCMAKKLVRSSESTTRGVKCEACGFEDLASSSFLLAEDEGVALEPLLLDKRSQPATRDAAHARHSGSPGISSEPRRGATMESPWPARK